MLTDRESVLRKCVGDGYPLVRMAKCLPHGENGKPLSRQRIHQILKNFGLHDEWRKIRRRIRAIQATNVAIANLNTTPRGRMAASILKRLENDGYSVKWGPTVPTCQVEGFKVTIHVMLNSYGGRFHFESARPNTLRICLFNTGRLIMILPDYDKEIRTVNFPEKIAHGPDSLVPVEVLHMAYEKYRSKVKANKISKYAIGKEYKLDYYLHNLK